MPKKQWRRTARQMKSMLVWRIRILFWGGAVLVGLTATALALASDEAGLWFSNIIEGRPWLPFLLTPLGLIGIAWMTRRFFPAAEGSGIPQAIAMLEERSEQRRNEVLGLGVGLFKGFMVVLGVGCGASIGREGPTVHIAASISYSLSKWVRFPFYVRTRGLILAGAAAGLSAAFNTPLAGIVFAIEEMSRNFSSRTIGFVFMAVVIAGITALSLQGNYHYFGLVSIQMEPLDALGAVLLCGLTGGLLGGLFSSLLIHGGKYFKSMRDQYPYRVAAVCGLTLACVGLLSGGMTYGTGYEQAQAALSGSDSGGAFYPLLKLLATAVSYLSGIPGGIFAPSLSAGANLGAELAPLLPSTPVVVMAFLGMAGYFAGVVQSPMTTVVIVMEMTDEQGLLLPLMATALLAQWVSRHICPKPLYLALAENFLGKPEEPGKKMPV